MTRMLVRVADPEDALVAAAGGADVAEIMVAEIMVAGVANKGAIGSIRAAFPGLLRLRGANHPAVLAEAALALGADEIAVAFEHVCEARNALDAMGPVRRVPRLAAVIPAEADLLGPLETILGQADAVMLDVTGAGRLVDLVSMAQLDAFARACRLGELAFGLAGGLESPDVARLLVLQPDLLGFDAAVRRGHAPGQGLDSAALEAIRALIPRDHDAPPAGDAPAATDRIFVRDFVVMLAIGAYQAEKGVRQRVRFSVEADVLRPPEPPADMRGVFSYDIIIETIRVLAERPHVTFVETLAEELAATLLAYPQIRAVEITAEKLDVIEGSAGVRMYRDRASLRLPLSARRPGRPA